MSDSDLLPAKLFFRIGEVAGLVGVEPHVLRYWEREFRSIRPTKSKKGQRVYSRKDVENLLRVRDLLYRDGFTIAGAKKQLQRGGVEPTALAPVAQPLSTPSVLELHEDVSIALAPNTEPALPTWEGPEIAVVSVGHATVPQPRILEQLTALRTEVEAFLLELEDSAIDLPSEPATNARNARG